MAFRARKPSILGGNVEYQCKTNTMPDWDISEKDGTFCGPEYRIKIPIFLDYGPNGSYTHLKAVENTVIPWVLKPDSAAVSDTNPSWTFSARVPFVPPMKAAGIGERMSFDLELIAEDTPIQAP